MSLDLYLTCRHCGSSLIDWNVTHNLTKMAREAGIYRQLWRPDECGVRVASDLIEPVEKALAAMRAEPQRFMALNPVNGWGTYDGFLTVLDDLLEVCKKNPTAEVSVSR